MVFRLLRQIWLVNKLLKKIETTNLKDYFLNLAEDKA